MWVKELDKGFDLHIYYLKTAFLLVVVSSVEDLSCIQSVMKSCVPRVGLRGFVAVFVLGFVFQGACTKEDLHHEDEVAEKHLLLDKRSVGKNATPSMPDMLKRLKALEEKWVMFLIFLTVLFGRSKPNEKVISNDHRSRWDLILQNISNQLYCM